MSTLSVSERKKVTKRDRKTEGKKNRKKDRKVKEEKKENEKDIGRGCDKDNKRERQLSFIKAEKRTLNCRH